MNKNEQDARVIKTKKAIKDSFIKLLKNVPYNKFTISDICQDAKIHRATFYNYYRNKTDLLFCLLEADNRNHLFLNDNNCLHNNYSNLELFIDALIEEFYSTYLISNSILESENQHEFYSIINKSIYIMLYEFFSFNNYHKNTPKDLTCSFYAGALTSLYRWLINNQKTSKDEFKNYVHEYLKF